MECKGKVLIVEDEWRIARFLQLELEHEGFAAQIESNGRRGWQRAAQETFDILLLDRMLPEMDGVEICRRVREISSVPIILLTAKDAVADKICGLDSGADDYVTKPFDVQELLARIRAALRKRQAAAAPQPPKDVLTVKNLALDRPSRSVSVDGQSVELTKREYDLLAYLLENKGLVLTRDQILQAVWGYDYLGDTNAVDVYIRYLRAKLDDRFGQKYIHTVRGVGYAIKE